MPSDLLCAGDDWSRSSDAATDAAKCRSTVVSTWTSVKTTSAPVIASFKHSDDTDLSASAPASLYPLHNQSPISRVTTQPYFTGSSSNTNSQLFNLPPSSRSSAPTQTSGSAETQASGRPSYIGSASVSRPFCSWSVITNCSSTSASSLSTQSTNIFGTNNHSQNFGLPFPSSSSTPFPPNSDTCSSGVTSQRSSDYSFAPPLLVTNCTNTANSSSDYPFRFDNNYSNTTSNSGSTFPFIFGNGTSSNSPSTESSMIFGARRSSVTQNLGSAFPSSPSSASVPRCSSNMVCASSQSLAPPLLGSDCTTTTTTTSCSQFPFQFGAPTSDTGSNMDVDLRPSTTCWRWSGDDQSRSSLTPSSRASSDNPSARVSTFGLTDYNADVCRSTESLHSSNVHLADVSMTSVDTGVESTWSSTGGGSWCGSSTAGLSRCSSHQVGDVNSSTSVSWARQNSIMSVTSTSSQLGSASPHDDTHYNSMHGISTSHSSHLISSHLISSKLNCVPHFNAHHSTPAVSSLIPSRFTHGLPLISRIGNQ